ncbi:uncharacterized protein LOC117299699 [Asterias rubens]|uniref:uncharacterized protein LOC117299699 n=1 Tax=Asterias rubens TaxID=7604 RepID=UPI0014555042|nr:uncharacterized protein LOC117299699 [Asterias rubens]
MCVSGTKNQPSLICLIPLALLCMLMGGGLVGTWVACYYECLTGKLVEFNYYVSVWTGGVAFFSGLLQLFLSCCWNKPLKYFMVLLNTVLLLCCLACAALMGYNTYEEVVLYDALEDTGTKTTPSLGTILTGLEALLALFILLFIIIWTCAIGCSGSDDYPDASPERRQTRAQTQQRGYRGPYDEEFFNRNPIYQGHQQQERPQEVMYGQNGSSSTRGKGTNYVIPRASVRGQEQVDDYYGNERAMVVDGREGYHSNDTPKGFYTGSSRHGNKNGGAYQNETGTFRVDDLGSHPGDITNNRYGNGISLMQLHGIAPTTNNINHGYY